MKIVNKKPWFWFIFQVILGVKWEKHILTFGDTIYSSVEIEEERLIHESVHLRQQGYSKIKAIPLILRYLWDKNFRVENEMEAYQAECDWIVKTYDKKTAAIYYEEKIKILENDKRFQGTDIGDRLREMVKSAGK